MQNRLPTDSLTGSPLDLMARLVQQLLVHEGITVTKPVSICGKSLNAVLNTWAKCTVIDKQWITDLELHLLDSLPIAVTGTVSEYIGSAQEVVLPLYIGATRLLHTALFTEISAGSLLGSDFIFIHQCMIELCNGTFTVGDTVAPLPVQRRGSAAIEECGNLVVRQTAILCACSPKITFSANLDDNVAVTFVTGDIPNAPLLPLPAAPETRDCIAPVSLSILAQSTRSGSTRRLHRHLTD